MTILLVRVLVVGLAAWRLARVVAVDSISEPFRLGVYEAAFDTSEPGAPAVRSRPLSWFYGLISCAYCASWWIALALYACWVNWGWSRPFIAGVAVAGVAAQLAGFDRVTSRD